jgi:cysteine-rich repeat protein
VQKGVEACDDGNNKDNDACLNTCVSATCGDGVVQPEVEACDDGNNKGGDGCDEKCQPEAVIVEGGSCAIHDDYTTSKIPAFGASLLVLLLALRRKSRAQR